MRGAVVGVTAACDGVCEDDGSTMRGTVVGVDGSAA